MFQSALCLYKYYKVVVQNYSQFIIGWTTTNQFSKSYHKWYDPPGRAVDDDADRAGQAATGSSRRDR